MARNVGEIIARGDRRWLIRLYLAAIRKPRNATTTIERSHGLVREAQAYLTIKLRERGRDLAR
jgi:hypothetical protein